MKKFITKYDYVNNHDDNEKNSGEYLIDDTGYIDAKRQITDILKSGQALDEYRRGTYEYEPDDNTPSEDIELNPFQGVTEQVDGDNIAKNIVEKLTAKKIMAEATKASDDELKSTIDDIKAPAEPKKD